MPFKSDAQRKFFNANRPQLEAQGVDVGEYNEASKGKSLPARAPKAARRERRKKSKYDFLKRNKDRGVESGS